MFEDILRLILNLAEARFLDLMLETLNFSHLLKFCSKNPSLHWFVSLLHVSSSIRACLFYFVVAVIWSIPKQLLDSNYADVFQSNVKYTNFCNNLSTIWNPWTTKKAILTALNRQKVTCAKGNSYMQSTVLL